MRNTSGGDHAPRIPLTSRAESSIPLAGRGLTRSYGGPVIHSGVDLPQLHELIDPRQRLWTPHQLRHLTSTVAAELAVPLLQVVRFIPEQRWWVRLALTGGVELWLLSWLPGQETKPHDHGGACGSFAVLLGNLTEEYRYPGRPSRCVLHRVGADVGFGQSRAHRIRNLGRRGAVSVHAYSPPLLPMREYANLGDGTRLPTSARAS